MYRRKGEVIPTAGNRVCGRLMEECVLVILVPVLNPGIQVEGMCFGLH